MWFIADAWARSKGGHSGVQHHGIGDQILSDNEIGFALIGAAILISSGWLLFEFLKMLRNKRQQGRPMARAAAGLSGTPAIVLDGRRSRLNDRVRTTATDDA